MPAGCHDSKIWFFPLMEMTDDNAPGESRLPFRCLHVALIGRLMESAWKWGLSIHLVSPERVSGTAELSFPGNQPLRDNSGSALRADVKMYSDGVLTTTVVWTPPPPPCRAPSLWASTYLNHTHTGVQEDGSFGFFGDLLIFVEVQVIGAVAELRQVEIPPLEGLRQKCRSGIWNKKQ